MADKKIIIEINKNGFAKQLFWLTAFLVAGVLMFLNANSFDSFPLWIIYPVSILIILFTILGAVGIVRKQLDKKPGLIISKEGIFDNSSPISIGLIDWKDIDEIKSFEMKKRGDLLGKFISIILKDPGKYTSRASGIKKIMMKLNSMSYETPIHISDNSLNYNFEELLKTLIELHKKHIKSSNGG